MKEHVLLFLTYLVLLLLLAWPLGKYITKVFLFEKTLLDFVLLPLEKLIYRLIWVKPEKEMTWKQYATSLMLFNFLCAVSLYFIQIYQNLAPWNPEHLSGVTSWDLAINTSLSFITCTNWQAYVPENTMSYFTQMTGLTTHDFLATATGLAVAIALIRGLIRPSTDTIGNFWVDLVRGILWILLPLSLLLALILVEQGAIQNLTPYITVHTLEGLEQRLAMGPTASQQAITVLGANGSGFFNAYAAHPFANPTPLTNFLQIISMFLIPAALVMTFGRMVKDRRQGYSVLGAMLLLFVLMLSGHYLAEYYGNPILQRMGVNAPTAMEGKEVRFGIEDSALFATVTTAGGTGEVNAMHDSFMPLGGLVTLIQMKLGGVIFGGVGCGIYGILMYVVLTMFIVGLMVGRTPEYLGKKIEAWEIKMATFGTILPSLTILASSAVASVIEPGTSAILNPGPHGLTEIVYAFASCSANNGSAFAGLNVNSPFYNLTLALAMFIGRFGVIIPALAIAGSMAKKRKTPPSLGTFPSNTWLFSCTLAGVILIVGGLIFLPALTLGPILEHFQMIKGICY